MILRWMVCNILRNIFRQIDQVFDYDWGLQDDFMGSALLDLTTLELSRVTELSVPLEDSSRSAGSSADSKSKFDGHIQITSIRLQC